MNEPTTQEKNVVIFRFPVFKKKSRTAYIKNKGKSKIAQPFLKDSKRQGKITISKINKRVNSSNQNLFHEQYEISLIGQIVIRTAMPYENGTLIQYVLLQ